MAISKEQQDFVAKVGAAAREDMSQSGILASLTIAQAILESGWGTSALANNANALFGIKADSRWDGKVYSTTTKECYDGASFTEQEALFRAYDSWEDSIADRSAFLVGSSRYAAVIGEKDYKIACTAIHAEGYATDPTYAEKLITIIESYNLAVYDAEGKDDYKMNLKTLLLTKNACYIAGNVQRLRQNKRRRNNLGEMGMLSGVLFCNDCGCKLYQLRKTGQDRRQEYYICSTFRKRGECTSHYIRTVIVEELILKSLQDVTKFVENHENEFIKMVMNSSHNMAQKKVTVAKKQLAVAEKRYAELDEIFKHLYEDKIKNNISQERFEKFTQDYESEQNEVKIKITDLLSEIDCYNQKSTNTSEFITLTRKYTNITELTPMILNEFVEKVIIHSADKSNGKRTQKVDIIYKGVGSLDNLREE